MDGAPRLLWLVEKNNGKYNDKGKDEDEGECT